MDFSYWCVKPEDQQVEQEKISELTQKCLKQSNFKQYSAKTTSMPFSMEFSNESIAQFRFKFVSNMRHIREEILVMDSIGLLGSLGGSLGLFVGFSFYGYFDILIEAFMARFIKK